MYNNAITRRMFLQRGLRWCGMTAIPGLAGACVGRATGRDRHVVEEACNLSLRDIAHKKLHHGNGCFLNVFGGPLHGNPWWPSLTQTTRDPDSILYNFSYKPYYKDEPIVPVSIDWKTVRRTPGLSMTFIKHACIIIKDEDQYIWGSFRLTAEPVHFPPIQLKQEMAKAGIADHLVHLDHGETLYYHPN